MYCPACGTELDNGANYCRACGVAIADRRRGDSVGDDRPAHARDPRDQSANGAEDLPRTESATPAAGAIPPGAAAVDITCHHCGRRPIEEMATGHRITAFVVAYHQQAYQLIGCHRCIRRKLWWMALKNLVFGWWAYPAALWNAVLTAKNIGRGAIRRGPNANLIDSLEAVGVTYDYLDDPSAFDPDRHSPMELYIRSFVRLGTAVMLADDESHPAERRAIEAAIRQLAPGYPAAKLDALIERASQSPADVEAVAAGIGELLSPAGEELLVEFVASVAEGGVTDEAEIELVATITRALDMDEYHIDEILADERTASSASV